ncbi:MAG: uncharacterized protein KVP18_001233, partial [Porospora cf. gigantea A]
RQVNTLAKGAARIPARGALRWGSTYPQGRPDHGPDRSRSRQRETNATVLISDRSLLATVFQWGHSSSIGVARWFLGAPPLSLYHPEDTTFGKIGYDEEITRHHIRRRGRQIGDISEETFYFGFNGTRIKEVKKGLARFVQQLKAVYNDVRVVRTLEGRTSILRQLDLL